MRSRVPTMPPIDPSARYRATSRDDEEASQSSSSNSPTRAEYEESDFFAGNNDSQSSIGVPMFQDMAVSEEACLPIVNRLPAEVLIAIFSKLSSPADLLNCMLVSKKWARNSVDLLWHRPACTTWVKHSVICRALSVPNPYFAYRDFIKRLNLATLADRVNDGSVQPLSVCNRVERLTLTNCAGLTDHGLGVLIRDNNHLLAVDMSGAVQITEASMNVLADNCPKLQGLNISGCHKVSGDSLIKVAENCKHIKRLKLNDCSQLEDPAIMAFATNCPHILEIDLEHCKFIGSEPVTALLTHGQNLRELRLANCELISDSAFTSLPSDQTYEHLRILDLTSCARLTDRAIERIIDVAPRLRNLVLAKCRNITDVGINAISKLGKNLHYLHLGHCGHITDQAVINLVQCCNRIRYIDLGCCVKLTDHSVMKLATLPKLRRIGLVKCNLITDDSVYALSQYRRRFGDSSDLIYQGTHQQHSSSSLERVHLSYCTNLTLRSIIVLLNNCPRLTHLSLTGVHAFLRHDLEIFCRDAPSEFTAHQRQVFCVFSGQGVVGLRRHLNDESARMPGTTNFDTVSNRHDDDDNRTMTGMMGATALNGGEEEVDEELEDVEDGHNGIDGSGEARP